VWRLCALLSLALPHAAHAATCRDIKFEATSFTICTVAADEDLRLFHSDATATPYGSFTSVNNALAQDGHELAFAMNAGMFHRDLAPVGLYIESGTQTAPLVTRAGPGNFGLRPNGVFCIADTLRIVESSTFAAEKPNCRFATQSGPMLVINGALHPKFLPNSDSLNIRNGVGVSADGSEAVFAISNTPVNFHQFARLFRDALHLPNALYFDGSISRLYAPTLGRHDAGFPMGPIVGVVVPRG
jgi:uncharacterized protein YigE (DUF2233 family)